LTLDGNVFRSEPHSGRCGKHGYSRYRPLAQALAPSQKISTTLLTLRTSQRVTCER
jgi:hypothetical protein